MRVLVTRPAAEGEAWVRQLRERGFDAVGLPLIAIGQGDFRQQLDLAWAQLADARAAMFVSANAVRGFFAGRERGQWPLGTRAWAPGPGTRQALLDHGVPAAQTDSPNHDAAQFDSEALWAAAGRQVIEGDVVLVVRGAGASGEAAGREWLADQLRAAGAAVHVVASYARVLPSWTAAQVALARESAEGGTWLFSSSQAIEHLQRLMPEVRWNDARAVVTHPRIAEAARNACFGVVCVSRPSLDDVARALESFR
jgi:uroporphyrinogen-III synthase